jgi:hypothetical protein
MTKYNVICRSSNSEFPSYEKYINHIFEKHEDQPSLRMRVIIVKKEISDG